MPDPQDPRQPRWWPSEPSLLMNTAVCPACFRPLGGTLCATCGLDLSVPSASELLAAGTEVVSAENRRQDLVALMRVEQRERVDADERVRQEAAAAAFRANPAPSVPGPAAAPTSFSPVEPAPPAFAPPPPVPHPHYPQPAYPQPGYPGAAYPQPPVPAVPSGPRRSGIQILMLTVGVILVSIMALFFVLLAYLVASLEVRSVLTGVASVVIFGVAVLLYKRRLTGTAEGISALAVVLFLLDLWIIRANGLFGSDGVDGWLYTGVSTAALAGLLALAFRVVPLRTLSLSAAVLTPIAVFTLTQGVLIDVDPWTRAWTALAAVGAASLLSTRIRRSAERTLIRVGGMLALTFAGIPAFGAFPDVSAGATLAFAGLAVIWFCVLVVTRSPSAAPSQVASSPAPAAPIVPAPRTDAGGAIPAVPQQPGPDAWATLAAVGLGLAVSGAGLSLFFRSGLADAIFWLPASATALAAVVVAALVRVPRLARLASTLRVAAVIPLTLAILTMAPALITSVAVTSWGALTTPLSLAAFSSPEATLVPLDPDAPVAVLLVALLSLACLALLGTVRRIGWAPIGLAAFALVACGAVIGQPLGSSAFVGLLSAALLTAVAFVKTPPIRIALGTVLSVSLLVFWTIGVSSTATFPVVVLAAVAMLVAVREVILRTMASGTAAILTPFAVGSAVIAVTLGARLVPTWIENVTGTTYPTGTPALWMTLAALLLVSVPVWVRSVFRRQEEAVLATIAAIAGGTGLAELAAGGETIRLVIALALTGAVALAWQLRDRVSTWPERYVAAACVPAAVLWGIGVAWVRFAPAVSIDPISAAGITVAAGAVVLAACAPFLFRRPGAGSHPARIAWDVSLAIAAGALVVSVAVRPELGWITLVLLAVAAMLVSSGDGDIVTGGSPRRHVAWVGFPLAVAGLWLGVFRADGTVVEFYTLPVAGLLLAILVLVLVRHPRPEGPATGRTVLLAAALAVGMLPSAVTALGNEPFRAVVVLVAAAGLVVAGALAPPVRWGISGGLTLWLAGSAGALVAGFGRAVLTSDARIPFEAWSGGAAAVLLTGGLLWQHRARRPVPLAPVVVGAAVVVLALPTFGQVLFSEVESWRALLVLVAVCVAVFVASVYDAFPQAVRWVAFACALVLGGALLASGSADPFELATAPLAIALLAAGGIRLARDAHRRSWVELGPGLVLLLLPSLVADFAVENELWRIVALGVAALAVLGLGLALRLQAPTLVGAVVVVLHGLAQLWPWISGLYGSVPWWLWAGIGGVILIVLAATYESRIRDLKAVARGVSSLR
ncbi:hypothetical protein IWX78_001263 [Mycetocola sp. CAN_C7]|uniref:SCO7613 C-terminal domain-containing membrane protein n=1 Tax=Mycetocola sp. CAN_C7 TaxID=2787724 RepID=UPI0018C924B9